MDVLSEILKAVRLEGAFYYNGEFTAPWGFRAPESCDIAPYFHKSGSHVIIYHLLTEGSAVASINGHSPLRLSAGDIVIFPHGHSHILASAPGVEPVDLSAHVREIVEQGLSLARAGGGGPLTRFVCGYMSSDRHLSQVLLAGLPPVLRVSIGDDPTGRWLVDSIRLSVSQAVSAHPGGQAVLAKLSETLFIETLRRYISGMPAGQTGWLAGARDPEIGKALSLIHARPAHPWTLAALAQEAGVSRSVFAERFRHYLGEPPVTYLTRWRLHLGARILTTSNRSVAEVAGEVGYESEAAFNRAFKREFNSPPARFRSAARAAGVQ